MNPNQELRVAVIGLGQRSYLAELVNEPGNRARVVACADNDPGAPHRIGKRYGDDVAFFQDYVELLKLDLDAVLVTTPDHTHETIVVACLEAGIPVFAEKPLATTIEGCDRILDAAYRTGKKLYVGHNMRHLPVITTMRDLIQQGAIGEVKAIWCRHFVGDGGDYYFRDWHADRSKTTSLLLQKGAHDIDVMHWLCGSVTRRVTALGGLVVYGDITDRTPRPGQVVTEWFDREKNWPPATLQGLNPIMDVEDLSMVLMEMDSGVYASYQQCHFTPDYWRNYTVIGTEGRLENFGDLEGATVKIWSKRSGYRAKGDKTVVVAEAEGIHGGADESIIAEFLRFVREGGETATSPVGARDAVAAGCAATTSLRNGGTPESVPRVAADVAEWFENAQTSPAPTAPTAH